ncbi:hypothetical protein LJK88_19455 [Paenibacillus sp. P26]|nr:hypothetical protein LJK88_19455 [Paenibacillus sp. P26]
MLVGSFLLLFVALGAGLSSIDASAASVPRGSADVLPMHQAGSLQLAEGEDGPLKSSPAVAFSRFITRPWVSTLLLLIGIAGVAIELFVPGFGRREFWVFSASDCISSVITSPALQASKISCYS